MKLKTCLWLAMAIFLSNCNDSKKNSLVGDFYSTPTEIQETLGNEESRAETRITEENGLYYIQFIKKDGNWSDKIKLEPVSKKKIKELLNPELAKNVRQGLFLEKERFGNYAKYYFFRTHMDKSNKYLKTGYLACSYTTTSTGAPINLMYPIFKLD